VQVSCSLIPRHKNQITVNVSGYVTDGLVIDACCPCGAEAIARPRAQKLNHCITQISQFSEYYCLHRHGGMLPERSLPSFRKKVLPSSSGYKSKLSLPLRKRFFEESQIVSLFPLTLNGSFRVHIPIILSFYAYNFNFTLILIFYPEDRGITLLQNIDTYLSDYSSQEPRL
jgi:hypothetical protein